MKVDTKSKQNRRFAGLIFMMLGLMVSAGVFAFDVNESDIAQELLVPPDHSIRVRPSLDSYFRLNNERVSEPGMIKFYQQFGSNWDVQWDTRSNRPDLISGQGIPMIPGAGNTLTNADIQLQGKNVATLTPEVMSQLAVQFMEQNPEILKVDVQDLEMNPLNTEGFGQNNRLWFVHFTQNFKGVPVKNSDVFFRINNGNMTQFGAHQYVDVDPDFDVTPVVSEEEAIRIGVSHAETLLSGDLEIVQLPELFIVPVFGEGLSGEPGEPYQGSKGQGYGTRTIWEFKFRFSSTPETWFAVVDAQTGELLHFRDSNKYETVHGGVYPVTNLGGVEVDMPYPFASTSQGNTTSGGRFDYTGGTVTSSMNGQYVRISDNCGSVSLGASGDLDFGMSSGTDCTTPGFGGSGNTHSSRSCYYHIGQIMFKGRGYLPTNSWLQNKITANVDINDTCNAYWDGGSVNFFKSGGGCSNTGELASVFLHEWGHGLDDNTGTSSSEMASAEALADSMSFLQTHVSCIGHNFRPGSPCSFGCDSSCTGVRDAGVTPAVRPSNITQSPADCDRWSCPYWGYEGIMQYEGHCEALIAAGAVWDAANGLAAEHGAAGWALANRIYFETMGSARGAYQIASGGTCNPSATINGCGSQNWYTVWLFADDDNGNLTDGTPNGCIIWDAFNDHGIACGTQPTCYTTCPVLAAPSLTAGPGDNSANLSWTSVSGAGEYMIYRNTLGCNSEMNIIATTSSTQYTDDTVANDFTYFYSVQAVGSNDTCRSEFSQCQEVFIDGCINPPIVEAGQSIDACPGDLITLGGSPTASSGTPPFIYLWTPGNYTTANPQIYPNQTTTYTCTVTDSIGCVGMDTITITMDAPLADAGPDKSTCGGYCVQIGASPMIGYSYSWSPQTGLDNPYSSNPTACVSSNTVYTLTVTASGFLCEGQDTVSVTIDQPEISHSLTQILSDSGDSDGSLEAGERGTIRLLMTNQSPVIAYDLMCELVSSDPGVYVVSGPVSLGTLDTGGTAAATFEVVVDMQHECPDQTSLTLQMESCGGTINSANIPLVLGQPGGLETIYATGFEGADDEGWTHYQVATQDDWQRDIVTGVSEYDPSSAYEGSKVWGNDLGPDGWDGNYKSNVNNYLLSPALNCTGKTGIHLQFMRWLTVEEGIYDQATIYVNNTQVWQNQQNGNHIDTQWVPVDFDISAIADNNPSVQVKFELVSDAGLEFGGWNIDQFAVIADAPPECDVFECDSPDANAGNDFTVNPGSEAVLDGSASNIYGCSAGVEYRWSGGGLGQGIWSMDPVAVDYPSVITAYTLTIRCSASPEFAGCTDSDTVTVNMGGGPTATQAPPTYTPTPTPPNSPTPTWTQGPSPTPTPTHNWTNTPIPTNTPSPRPTNTSIPTYTPNPTFTPLPPTNTPPVTYTPTNTPTRTPTATATVPGNTPTPTPTSPSDTPTMTPTAGSTDTPVPSTSTPTVQPTATEAPATATPVSGLTVELQLSRAMFHKGDTFLLTTKVTNGGQSQEVDEYLLLSIDGMYWFYPDWSSELGCQKRTLDPGDQVQEIFNFAWPEVDGRYEGIQFLYLLTEPDTFNVNSNLALASFGYE